MQQYNGNAIKHLDAHCEKCVVIQMNQCYVHFVKRSYVKLLLSISCTEHNGCPEKTHSKLMEINVHVCTTELYVFAFPDQRVLFRSSHNVYFGSLIGRRTKGLASCLFTSVSSSHSLFLYLSHIITIGIRTYTIFECAYNAQATLLALESTGTLFACLFIHPFFSLDEISIWNVIKETSVLYALTKFGGCSSRGNLSVA